MTRITVLLFILMFECLSVSFGCAASLKPDLDKPKPVADDPLVARIAATMTLGRYMIDGQDCPPVTSGSQIGQSPIVAPYLAAIADSDALAKGIQVIACTYKYRLTEPDKYHPRASLGPWRTGFAIMLDLPKPVLAAWVVGACRKANIADVSGCARTLVNRMNSSNGGQYPITGFIAEGVYGANATECEQNGEGVMMTGLIAFRFGVTVQFQQDAAGAQPIYYCTTDPIPVATQERLVLNAPVTNVYFVARVAAIRRTCWPNPGLETVPAGTNPSPWQSIVNQSMITAIRTDSDPMFNLAARLLAKSPSCLAACN